MLRDYSRIKKKKGGKTLLAAHKLCLPEEKLMLLLFVPKQLMPLYFQDL